MWPAYHFGARNTLQSMHVLLEHTEFRYPQSATLVDAIHIPSHQLYHQKHSDSENENAFKSFLAAVEALHGDRYSHTIVGLAHDTKKCFICDKAEDGMHMSHHRKGSNQLLRFGPPPRENIADIFAHHGLYLEVYTTNQYSDALPICSDCKAVRSPDCQDYFGPAVRIAECAMAESIIYRQWKKAHDWHCCSTLNP